MYSSWEMRSDTADASYAESVGWKRAGIYHVEGHDVVEGYAARFVGCYEELVCGDWARSGGEAEDEGVCCCGLEVVDSVCDVISVSSSSLAMLATLVICWIHVLMM